MYRVLRFVSGMLVGGLVGGGVVLLLAPQSGRDTRRLIQQRVQAVLSEGRQAAQARRLQLEEELAVLKRPSQSRPQRGPAAS